MVRTISFLLFALISGVLSGQTLPVSAPPKEGVSEYAPSLHPDGKTIVFQSDRNGDWSIYGAHLGSQGWGEPFEVFQGSREGNFLGGPSFSANGRSLVFFADILGSKGSLDLFIASFDPATRTFGQPKPFPAPVNTEGYEAFPSLSPDGKTLYFVRNLPAPEEGSEPIEESEELGDCYQIMMAQQRADGSWGEPEPLPGQINQGCVGYPRIMPNGQILVFSRFENDGRHDFYATGNTEEGWSEPVPLTALNSPQDEKMASVTYNGMAGVWSVSREDDTMLDSLVWKGNAPFGAVAGWVWVDLRVSDPEGSPMEAQLEIRLEGTKNMVPVRQIGSSEIVQLQAGNSYLLSVFAEGHDFQALPMDLSQATGPDTLLREVVLRPLKKEIVINLPELTFEFNSANISPSATPIIQLAASFLQQNEGVKVELAAHTDDQGEEGYNLDLSRRRARAVVDALVAAGADRNRLVPKGYGESEPVADNSTEEGRAKNRRVEFRVLTEN